MKILVIGGTGTTGGQLTRLLLGRGVAVRVMTRSQEKAGSLPAGAEAAVADLSTPASLPAAFRGVDAAFLATPLAQDETHQGLEAVDAAVAAGVKKLVYMSVHRLEEGMHIPHFASKLPVEAAVKASGLEWTLIRPNNFYQNDLWFREAIVNYGVYPQPLGPGLSRVDVRDIAEAAAKALLEDGHSGRAYSLAGPEALTGERVAEIYSKRLGRPVRYTGGDLEAWAAGAAGAFPAWLLRDFKIMYGHFLQHGLIASREELAELERLLGHPPRRFESYAAELV